jgi:predicted chitinase
MRVAIEHALNADPVDFANQAEFLSQLANEAAVEQLAEAANQSLLRRLESITTGKIFTHAG